MTTTPTIVECENCGQQNRLPLVLPPGKALQCGRCHEPLEDDGDDEDDDDE
jgi:uncharacterized paraquat-inducible protein A